MGGDLSLMDMNDVQVRSNSGWRPYHKYRYGLGRSKYNLLFRLQTGVCAICGGVNKDGRRLAVDHCHKTGVVRGFLCAQCNHGLGSFKDNVQILKKAVEYLQSKPPINAVSDFVPGLFKRRRLKVKRLLSILKGLRGKARDVAKLRLAETIITDPRNGREFPIKSHTGKALAKVVKYRNNASLPRFT
jgi:hypothetical protein